MSRSRTPVLLVFALVLVGVATLAVARVRTANSRTLPYQGVLRRDGVGITGSVTARFGLFANADADTACVVTNDCPLWSEEQVVDVVDGTFAVLLGDGGARALTSTVLASPELFVAVAVKAAGDTGFTALSGVDEIVAAPLLQPGAATAASFASNTLFSANINYLGGVFYRVTDQVPSDWIPGTVTQAGSFVQIFTRQTFGVAQYRCTATALGTPRVTVIEGAGIGGINVGIYDGSGNVSPGSFTLMCHGF